jgi:hypothetical protein
MNLFTVPLFDRDLTTDISFLARILDLSAPFIASYNHGPILGNLDISLYIYYSELIRGISADIITNSWGGMAYFLGIPFMLLYFMLSYIGFTKLTNSYLVGFWYIVLLSANPVYTTIFNLFFIFGCLQMKRSTL